MRQALLSLAIIGLAFPFLAASPAQAQAARTWVSGTGNDANPCSRTAPCRTFDQALTVTQPGGEINCLDAGDFGGLNITMSVTISCQAGTAGMVAQEFGTLGTRVHAATTDVVTVRGLDIKGQDYSGAGIFIESAKAVHIEKCTIRNVRANPVTAAGIFIGSVAATIFLFVEDTVISDNSVGIRLASTGGFKVASLKNVVITGSTSDGLQLPDSNTYANVTKSIISGNGGSAVVAGSSSSTVNIDRSTIANNAVALNAAVSGATIRISGNNIYNNTTGFVIGGTFFFPALIESDNTNNTGGSNGGATVPNASLAKN